MDAPRGFENPAADRAAAAGCDALRHRSLRILFFSHAFAPSVGGLESVSEMLANEFVELGHEVCLVTRTLEEGVDGYAYPVLRQVPANQLLRLARWCDVYFHNNVSLTRVWPLLAVRRPWVVAHHVWIPRRGIAGRLKRLALRNAYGISVSRAIAQHISTPSVVVPNPYDETVFRQLAGESRSRDLVFVGRLVSDKGTSLLLDALVRLRGDGITPNLTIVGRGPEETALRIQARALDLEDRVCFAGMVVSDQLARLLNRHRIIIVPSVWDEPFGVVALEGIACGCVAIGSSGGGLADAVGPCGMTFPNGDTAALSAALRALLLDEGRIAELRSYAPAHLARHNRRRVAEAYIEVFYDALRAVR